MPASASNIRNAASTYIIGIGNSGRQDDGLGWALLEALEANPDSRYTFFYRYQLQVEDAELITQAEQVVFVDAHKGALANGYELSRLEPSQHFEFTSHVLPPDAVLHLAGDLYQKIPEAWLLLIEGHAWELQVGLTEPAKTGLHKALDIFGL